MGEKQPNTELVKQMKKSPSHNLQGCWFAEFKEWILFDFGF